MTEFSPNYGSFEVKGVVVGTLNDRFYNESDKKDNPWKRVQFGVKIDHNAFVYVEVLGIKAAKVKMVYHDPISKKIDKNKYIYVSWEEIYKKRNDGYKIHMPVKVSLKSENEDLEMTQYDLIDYLKQNLQEGDTVLISGSLQITEYQGKPQEKFIIQAIYSSDPDNFDSQSYERQAYFNQEIVFVKMEYDENVKRYNVRSNIIYKKNESVTFVPYCFKLNDDYQQDLVEFLSDLAFGDVVRVHGHISFEVPLMLDNGGNTIIGGIPEKHLIITGGSTRSLVKNRYSEVDFQNILNQETLFKEFAQEEELLPF
ncbi:hypothetical protein Elgi_37920 [Paenibacillus elgii]|uniref:hypothetical protein n=1 Tax=Paenibacillus elgii TaxID=189691 RepID=UPI002D7CA997|nr:hypothetical protein Elgi_37920 [Paenibacillus elgii]